MDKIIIPRNILNQSSTIPIDIMGHHQLEYRQIPYILIAVSNAVYLYNKQCDTRLKIIFSCIGCGILLITSTIKIENQSLEQIFINIIKYGINKKVKHE